MFDLFLSMMNMLQAYLAISSSFLIIAVFLVKVWKNFVFPIQHWNREHSCKQLLFPSPPMPQFLTIFFFNKRYAKLYHALQHLSLFIIIAQTYWGDVLLSRLYLAPATELLLLNQKYFSLRFQTVTPVVWQWKSTVMMVVYYRKVQSAPTSCIRELHGI